MGRIWAWAALAAAIWLLSAYGQSRPQPLGPDAPAVQFSAARADAVLGRLLDEQRPHPVGSDESARFRARLLHELAGLGVTARIQTAMSCHGAPRWGAILCGTVHNIVAPVTSGPGKDILLMAHTDSVAAGPGAADDGSGVATILETIRALKARKLHGGNPVTALFTDGEEAGLLGARAYLRDAAARARTGAVVNAEARGSEGPSYLFQTGAGNARLIDLYAAGAAHPAASSLYVEIYKRLPTDTDLTPFLEAGLTGYNFAFLGNAAPYHTPLDRRETIDPRSLQQHGDNMLGLAAGLSRADLAQLKSGDAIYLDVLGRWLPRLPADRALPLGIAAFVLIALAGLLARRQPHAARGWAVALLLLPLLLAGCVGMGFALHAIAAWVSGNADPSFAHPVYLRFALGFGVFAVALAVARGAAGTFPARTGANGGGGWASDQQRPEGGIASWLWFAALAIACALFAPGAAPYFLFPALLAAPLLLLTVRGGRGIALFVAALAGLIVWIGLAAGGEAVMGLKLHPLFTVSAAFGLIALLPLMTNLRGRAWGLSLALSLTVAAALAVVAGLQPVFSEAAPQRLNIRYVEQDGKAFWLADPVAHLPDSLRAAAAFSKQPQRLLEGGYLADAGPAQFPAPAAAVTRDGGTVTLDLNAPGDGVMLVVPQEASLQTFTIDGVTTQAPRGPVTIFCGTPDCGHARLTLTLKSASPANILLIAQRRGLPPEGAALLKARPPTATPSQTGDATLLAAKIAIPAR